MKKISLIALTLLVSQLAFGQLKLGNNVNSINVSSLLELESTTKGLLFSRLNTTQMAAMTPVNGMTIYNTDSACLCTYNGSSWVNLCGKTALPNLVLTTNNNFRSIRLGGGNTITFTVADGDTNSLNEIQTLTFANDTLYLSNNGGKVSLKSLKIDTTSLSSRINKNKQAIIDTASSLRANINTRVKYTDTAAMLAPYLRDGDTTSLSSRINKNKQAIIDTASSLRANINTRVKYTDTAAMLSPYLRQADNGLSKTGQKVQLGGPLTKPTTITTTGTNTLALAGLQSGSKTDSLLLADPSTGVVKRISVANLQNGFMKLTDTASLSSRINKNKQAIIDTASSLRANINTRVKYTDTAAMLAPYLRDGDTTSLSSRINKNKQAIIDTASSLRANINTRVKYTDTAAMLSPYLRQADNGLSKTGQKVQLGGPLTKPTTITTTGTNTLALAGLQSGSKTDSLLLADPSTGVVKRISVANLQNGFMKLTDTASLSSRINKNKQAIIDTASSLRANINTRVKYTDTAAMLAPYLRDGDTTSLSSRINKNKQAIIDTASSLRANINTRVKYTDTAAMLAPYLRDGDTTSLSSRINKNKQAIIDTASSLRANINTRVKYTDTAAMLSPYLRQADNGLSKTGQKVQLGGPLTKPTTITTTGTNTIALAGLQSGSKTDSLLLADPSTGVVKRISVANLQNGFMKLTDTASLSSRINKNRQAIIDTASSLRANINTRVKYTDTAAMLAPYLRDGDTTSLSSRINKNKQAVIDTASSLRANINTRVKYTDTAAMLAPYLRDGDTTSLSSRINKNKQAIIDTASSLRANINTRVKYTDTAAMLSPYLRQADNGLSKTGQKVQLGGALTKPTTITTTGTNTLALAGLQSGNKTDSLLVADPSTGVVKRISTANLQNGFMKLSDTTSLSSRINKNKQAIIDTATSLRASINTRVKYTDTAAMLAPYLRDGDTTSLSSRINKNKQAIIDTASSLRANINTRVKYTDTAAMLSPYLRQADNGLSKTGQKVQLGGPLTKPTTITTTGTNTLALAGLQSGSKTDSLLVADPSTGVVKRISVANLQNGFMKLTDTASLSSRINKNRQAIIDTATSLRANINTRVKYTDTAAMLTPYIRIAENGLTKTGKKVELGGNLTKATTIGTTSTNTLAVSGLPGGLRVDSVVVIDPSTNVLKRRSSFTNVINKTASYTLSVSDHGSVITINSSSATTLTVPSGLPIGFNISVYQLGTGRITISGASGVTIRNRQSRFRTGGRDAGAGLVITSSNTAHLTGDVVR